MPVNIVMRTLVPCDVVIRDYMGNTMVIFIIIKTKGIKFILINIKPVQNLKRCPTIAFEFVEVCKYN